jgi:hypothetical protein
MSSTQIPIPDIHDDYKRKKEIRAPHSEFEPALAARQRPQTQALELAATWIGLILTTF